MSEVPSEGPEGRNFPFTPSVGEVYMVAIVPMQTAIKSLEFIDLDGRVGFNLKVYDAASCKVI